MPALIANINKLFELFQYKSERVCTGSCILNYKEYVRDMFFAVESELSLRTNESLEIIRLNGYGALIWMYPITDCPDLYVRGFQIAKEPAGVSFLFTDNTPVRSDFTCGTNNTFILKGIDL